MNLRPSVLRARAAVALAVGPRLAYDDAVTSRSFRAAAIRFRMDVIEEMWAAAARAVGAEMLPLAQGFVEFRRGAASTRVRGQLVGLNDPVTVALAGEKPLALRLLAEHGLPVPDHLEFEPAELSRAAAFVARAGAACVVKPVSGSGSRGVTTGVIDAADLRRAIVQAAPWASRLLVERQAPGEVHRLLVLDGSVIGAVRREPPRVAGDGRSGIGELMVAETRRRMQARGRRALHPLSLDLDCLLTLREQGLAVSTVVGPGRRVEVKRTTGQGSADEASTIAPDDLAPSLVDAASRAAAALRLRLAGVDLAVPRESPEGFALIEVNGFPALHHHYLVAEGSPPAPVAETVLEALLEGRRVSP